MQRTVWTGLLAATLGICLGQVPPIFEVATLKRAAPGLGVNQLVSGGPGTASPTIMTYENVPLKQLLAVAFGVQVERVSGPRWLESERYDITAKLPEGSTRDQANRMLQALLIERLAIKLHHESKEQDGYELVLSKDGPKVMAGVALSTPAPKQVGASGGLTISSSRGEAKLRAQQQPMIALVRILQGVLRVPVLDKTGLSGTYSYEFAYSTEGLPGPTGTSLSTVAPKDTPSASDKDSLPSLPRALQQHLGLDLRKAKIPVDFVVVDQAQQQPDEN